MKNSKLTKLIVTIVAISALSLLVVGCSPSDKEKESVTESESFEAQKAPIAENTTAKDTAAIYYIVESEKPFDQASADLEAAVKRNGFGILQIHDLGTTLRKKGISFEEQVKIFEVCNPKQAAKVLSSDMRMSMALPCRISVFTEDGITKIGMIRPE